MRGCKECDRLTSGDCGQHGGYVSAYGTTLTCPFCGASLQTFYKYCPECGRRIGGGNMEKIEEKQ